MSPGIELELATWLTVAAVSGLLGLDGVSWPQVMASRPLVASTLGGALLGDPSAGVVAGAGLELLNLRHMPFGAAEYPETGPAGLVAGAAYAAAGGSGVPQLVAALLGGWALGWIGGWSVVLLRRINVRVMGRETASRLASEPRRIERRHRLAMAVDFLRGALLGAAFLVPAVLAVRLSGALEPGGATGVLLAGLAVALGAAGGSAARELVPDLRRGAWWLAGGLAAGVVLVGLS